MRNRSDKYLYKTFCFGEDIPKPKRNEIIIIPRDNRQLDIKPYLAKEKLPSWWKDLPVSKHSLRRCQGTYDYVQYGLIMPLWSDITIRPSLNGSDFESRINPYSNGDPVSNIEGFPKESAQGCPFSDASNVPEMSYPKFVCPWQFITPKGVSLMALPIAHEPNPNYIVMPGLVNTDYYRQLHIVIAVLTDKPFTIPAGTPMQHLIPIRRSENFKRIVWGNESMHRFRAGNGLGRANISHDDEGAVYRRFQKQYENEENYIPGIMSKIKKIVHIPF